MMLSDPHDALEGAKHLLENVDSDPKIREILVTHSCISAALALLPLPAASVGACMVNIYGMYMRINAALGVPFGKNVVRSVAGMIAANFSGMITRSVGLVASEVLKIIPGIGSIAGGLLGTAVLYSVTGVQGKIYCEWLRLMILRGAISPDGTFNGSAARSTLDGILSDKERIRGMMDELKKEARKADFKKYRDEAAAVLKKFMEEKKDDDAR